MKLTRKVRQQVETLLRQGSKIGAIKVLWQSPEGRKANLGLKEAKDEVERIQAITPGASMPPPPPPPPPPKAPLNVKVEYTAKNTPPIAPGYKSNLETMLRAAKNGDLFLVSCLDKVTGKPVVAVCCAQRDGTEITMIPIAKMFDGNPFEELIPPI